MNTGETLSIDFALLHFYTIRETAQVTNKRGPPEVDRALGLEGRTGMVYWGDAKHEQASSLSHERVASPPKGQRKEKIDSGELLQRPL